MIAARRRSSGVPSEARNDPVDFPLPHRPYKRWMTVSMLLHVESRTGTHGDMEPFAFLLGERRTEVVHIIDRWIGNDHSYDKVRASDLALYILRFTPSEKKWELTLFGAHAP